MAVPIPPPPTGPLLPGDPERLGELRLVGRLGSGGQGVVYLGDGPDGPVAVKLLHERLLGDPRARARFVRELSLLPRVAGFCTARFLGTGVHGDRPYLVSEYVPGPSLRELVAERGPRRGTDLDRLAVSSVTALAAIHRAGIVHRDVNPRNILLGPDGPRVIDFGVARALDGAPALMGPSAVTGPSALLTGGLVGTPAYMAPEQFSGGPVGPAADLFCWAATLVFAASGEDPFGSGPTTAVIYRVMSRNPDLSALPPHLAGLAAACLAKDPASRPTAESVLLTLLGAPAGDVPEARSGRQAAAEPSSVPPGEPSSAPPAEPSSVPPGEPSSAPPAEPSSVPPGESSSAPVGRPWNAPVAEPSRVSAREDAGFASVEPVMVPAGEAGPQSSAGGFALGETASGLAGRTVSGAWFPGGRAAAVEPAPRRRPWTLAAGLGLASLLAAGDVVGLAAFVAQPELSAGPTGALLFVGSAFFAVLAVITFVAVPQAWRDTRRHGLGRGAVRTVAVVRIVRIVLWGAWSLWLSVPPASMVLQAALAALAVGLLLWGTRDRP
ncbi:serine/threonine-protein kinase [Actinomadura logoneensis]|uniref:serine/threonine-protein kinase n=1 Tax=Actinomadura logoneensis TaxID=2293572 RepID=UPI0018F18E11|nr:serine/threonine-protein kinase [Actinomadura logoneensis]